MLLIRDLMFCKPGKVRTMVEKFKAMKKLGEKKGMGSMRILTDLSAERYWTVISEIEVASLEAFMAMGQPGLPKDIDAVIGFRLGRETYRATIRDGGLRSERGPAEGADAIFSGTPAAIAAAIYGGLPLDDLERDGALSIEGDRALAERFVTLFPLPPKAPVPA